MIKQQFIDYFKLFKIYDLKKLQKTGQVKIVQDKILMRKILSVEGTVSTENFTTLTCSNHPNILFKHQYLYLQAYCDPGKAFTFQITYFLSSKQYKIICSTMYKQEFKKKADNLFHFRLKMPTDKWTVMAIDLYSLVNWDQSFKNDQDLRLGFRVSSIEIRACSKVRGMFQSDVLYGPQNLPKDMELPLRGEETFFDKYAFVVTGLNATEELKYQMEKFKENTQENQTKGEEAHKSSKSLKERKEDKSQQKNQQKIEKKNLSREKPKFSEQKNKEIRKSASFKGGKTQKNKPQKSKQVQNQQQTNFNLQDEDLAEQQTLQPPKPAASLSLSIQAIQGLSLVHQNLISCESFLIQPVLLPTHKKITRLYKSRLGKVLVAYVDGSVCVWDTIRKEAGFYFRSQLQEIKCLLMDYDCNIVIVGLDKLKRQVIEIVSEQAIIFKQISTFNIKSIKLISSQTFQLGLISIGYQNIRLWSISPTNNIINGYSVYLGKMARNVTYNDCCVVDTMSGTYAFVCDSEGYVTKVNINEKKMEGAVKVDNCGVDHVRLIKYLGGEQKILVANQKGTVKLLSCVSMETELQYPLSNRIKTLHFKENPKNNDIPNLLIQTYNKTIAQLDLVDSTFHFITRSHYQPVTHIEYEKSAKKLSSLQQDKIVTAGQDSTMRVWKMIKTSDTDVALKEEYQFLINGQSIIHICMSQQNNKTAQGFVYMITDKNKLRKISLGNYQIVKEKTIHVIENGTGNKEMKVLSLALNNQGKVLLIVCDQQVLVMDEELEIVQYKSLTETVVSGVHNKKGAKINPTQKFISGFNSHKKSLFFENPITQCIEFYQLKDLQNTQFQIPSPSTQRILSLQWDNDNIHCITSEQYQLYERDNLLRVVPFKNQLQLNSSKVEVTCIVMNYPMLCMGWCNKETGESFVGVQVINRPGLSERIKMPQRISQIKITKPINVTAQFDESSIGSNNWQGEIICSGEESYSMYALKYSILNIPNIMSFTDQTAYQQLPSQNAQTVSFFQQKSQRNTKIPKIDNANISFISNSKQTNNLDISFSETATLFLGNDQQPQNFRKNNFVGSQMNGRDEMKGPPAQLRKLYEEEEKVFEQCKKAVFGGFFDDDQKEEGEQHQQENDQEFNESEFENQERAPENGKIKMKMFFGVDSRQSLLEDVDSTAIQLKKKQQDNTLEVGSFYWSSPIKLVSFLTNSHKSLLIHQFTQPSVSQRLIHLYSKPSSICWSYQSPLSQTSSSSSSLSYYIICYNSIIKLYNSWNKFSYIRSIQNELLIKDKHVVFSSFVTGCNTFLVVLTYRLQQGNSKANNLKEENYYKPSKQNNKLYIFVIELSSGKIISSSYRQITSITKSRNRFQFQKSLKSTYRLIPNRYSQNSQLQFILLGTNELSFYRVTSMFTLQMLQLEEITHLTREKTQNITTASYVMVEKDVYLLLGTENGSVVIVDSRSGSILLVLMNLLVMGSGKGDPISKIQFLEEHYEDGEIKEFAKLVFFCKGSNTIRIITLSSGINTLIQQVEMNSTTVISSNQSLSSYQTQQQNQSSMHCINLDSEIISVSTINNTTQQLILTKSSTLWLVDYEDYCSIKIFSTHSSIINEARLLPFKTQKKHFISCSEDGYVKLSDVSKLQQHVEVFKPRKPANCLEVQGNFTVCGFMNELYFYEPIKEDDVTNFSYLGSLQFENQNVLKVKNAPFSDNYYVLTDQKRKESLLKTLSKSQLSMQQSNLSMQSKGLNNTLPKVQIYIEIQLISEFSSPSEQKGKLNSSLNKPIWLQINPFRPYDQFSIGFRGGKVQTWQRKCLKRTLNPLQELSNVQSLEYYLIDVYTRKQTLQPYIQFISERQYMVSLSELNKIQVRNYKEHSIIRQIAFSQQFLQGIRTFRYFVLGDKKTIANQQQKSTSFFEEDLVKTQSKGYFNHMSSLKKGPLILIGDQFGYFSVCDMNGLVIEKEKVFNSPVESIQVHPETESQSVAFTVFLKSQCNLSLLNVYH